MLRTDLDEIVRTFLKKGLTVCYADKSLARREAVRSLWLDTHQLTVLNPVLSARALPHFNVLITVNEEDFDQTALREIRHIPGYVNGIKPITLRVTL